MLFGAIFILIFSNDGHSYNYNDFNQNVKNYNKNLLIIGKNGEEIAKYKVAIADSEENRSYGLMNLKHLDSEKGMLFLFKKHAIIAMWMKNTLIPLDMIFIDGDEIVWIAKKTTPHSLKHITSKYKIDKVLEVNSGEVEKNGIKIGDRIKL